MCECVIAIGLEIYKMRKKQTYMNIESERKREREKVKAKRY